MRVVFCILILLLVSCKDESRQHIENTKVLDSLSEPLTKLGVYDYDGLQKYLSTKSDSIYVVNFWATWCAPCVKELPYFEELNRNYKDKSVQVILVSLDFPKKYESSLKPFIKEKKLESKVFALNDPDSNSWIPKVSEDWSGAIPATLIFNKNKRQFYEQSFTYDELETEVKQFIK